MIADTAKQPVSRFWVSERFIEPILVAFSGGDELRLESELRGKKILDLNLAPGRVTGKAQSTEPRLWFTALHFTPLSQDNWHKALEILVARPFLIGKLLCGEVPDELEAELIKFNLSLIPNIFEQAQLRCDCGSQSTSNPCLHTTLLADALKRTLEEDPTQILTLQGKPTGELVNDALKMLTLNERQSVTKEAESEVLVESFYSLPQSSLTFSYDLRADELPGAVLRRLGMIPLGAHEEEVEGALEQIYLQVAKRSQVYGLSLREHILKEELENIAKEQQTT